MQEVGLEGIHIRGPKGTEGKTESDKRRKEKQNNGKGEVRGTSWGSHQSSKLCFVKSFKQGEREQSQCCGSGAYGQQGYEMKFQPTEKLQVLTTWYFVNKEALDANLTSHLPMTVTQLLEQRPGIFRLRVRE